MPIRCPSPVRMAALLSAILVSLLSVSSHAVRQPSAADTLPVRVPDGFVVERVAGPDLLSYPMFGMLDEAGRLFVFESTQPNTMTTEEMLAAPSYHIRVLEDVDGDGRYDRSVMYAEKLPFPKGGAFVDGSLYVAAAPDLIRFGDTNGDLVADERETVLTGWTLNVNGAAMGGPFLGPDGWLYITDARRGFRITRKEGDTLEGKGARIWRVRPDGTGLESLAGGGFDNSTEIVFMPSGDTIGTMTYFVDPRDGLRDGLMHWVEGGVYPKPHEVIAADGLTLTGDLMPTMTPLARVAPSGLLRYRGEALGEGFHGSLFSAQFNTGRVMRHVVSATGATYRTDDEPFLSSTRADVHPTDVLQDADGSLLVIETGGWFIKGCPLSRVAKPEVGGGIYRIRRAEARPVSDPRGQALAWDSLTPARLGGLLADPRPFVRDRALDALVHAGAAGVPVLADARRLASDVETRAAAVFALHRVGTPVARAAVRDALTDREATVRVAAARSVGLTRDEAALPDLLRLVATDEPPVRRQAATALAQIGRVEAVPALLQAADTPADRFVEHAVIYALIRLGQVEPLTAALTASSSSVRRAALIALDQITRDGQSPLTTTQVRPFLQSPDEALWRTGIWVAAHHPGWSSLIVEGVRGRLEAPMLAEADATMLRDVIVSVCRDGDVQRMVSAGLSTSSGAARGVLFHVVQACPGDTLPEAWVQALRTGLGATDGDVRAQVLRLVAARRVTAMAPDLARIVADGTRSTTERLGAMDALVIVRPSLDDTTFAWLTSLLPSTEAAPVRQQVAGILAQAALTDAQLVSIADTHVSRADAFLLPRLVAAFDRATSARVGLALVAALSKATDRLDVVSERDLALRLEKFPSEVKAAAAPLMVALRQRQNARLKRLESLDASLGRGGDIDAGRRVFFGKATCATCHAVGREGATFGPDLSNIGEIRSRHDILEAILYPSASFAREYETWRVRTKTGENVGILKEDLPGALVLETGPGASVRIPRASVVAVEPVEFSAMPPGLEALLTPTELADLMAYLEALPDPLDRRSQR